MARAAYLLLIPLIAVLLVVEVYPVISSFALSLTEYTEYGTTFVGVENYARMVLDLNFWNSVLVSLAYSFGSTLLFIITGLFFAFLLSFDIKGRGVFETIFIVPLAAAPIVTGILWSPSGLWDDINTFLHFILGLQYIDLTVPFVSFSIMILSDAWEWAPMMMVISLSVMSSIPKENYEAASVHGASTWQVFRYISLPNIMSSPVTHFVVAIRLIDAMRAFEIPFAWSNWLSTPQAGSPVDTLSLYLFKLIVFPAYGLPIPYIATIAVSLLLLTLVATLALMRSMKVLGRL